MKDWLHDDEQYLARVTHTSIRKWRKMRREFIGRGLLRAEVHPVEGPILRAVHPEHIVAVGMLMGRL